MLLYWITVTSFFTSTSHDHTSITITTSMKIKVELKAKQREVNLNNICFYWINIVSLQCKTHELLHNISTFYTYTIPLHDNMPTYIIKITLFFHPESRKFRHYIQSFTYSIFAQEFSSHTYISPPKSPHTSFIHP